MDRRDDAGEKANAPRRLRRGGVEPQRKRRTGKQILPAFGNRKEVVAKLVRNSDLLENLGVKLLLGFPRIGNSVNNPTFIFIEKAT